MRCPSCRTENPDGAKFCVECGVAVKRCCPNCGVETQSGAKFCAECGTSLTRQSPVVSSQLPVASPPPPRSYTPPHLAERILAEQAALEARGGDGERKTITALFADIKGSMELLEDRDPEEARALIDPALRLMMDAVHRYEGYVAQSLGDGIFALFGAPIAHEDHPQRALYAALHMQEEIRRYAETLRLERGINLEIRVGVNTGEVVVRSIRKDDLHTDYVPVGHSTSLAARLEGLATGGAIVVSAHTHRLIEGYFHCKALGAAQIKGVSEPIHIYEVLGVGPLRTKLQVAARRGLVRFVGRQSELEHLQKAVAQAKAGRGQIVGVMGEPGVGKSRLFHEFVGATHASPLHLQQGCLILETFSVSHGKAYAYLPLIDLLKHYFQITLQDDERVRQEKVGGKVLMLDRSLEDTLPYLFFLLGIAEPTSSLQQMDPQIRKRRTLEAIKRLLVRESLNQPLILVFEDLHWLDAETQAFLLLLSESVATARILLLVNYRPEYRHEWGSKTYYTQLRLDPLGREQAEELLTALLGDRAPLQSIKRLILEKTEGNPFFIEEIVQALHEQGVLVRDLGVGAGLRPAPTVKPITDLHLPPTVQAVLASRIDRLPAAEKDLLQTLAVIGKEFSLSLLTQVVDQPEAALHPVLSHLQAAEFIYEQPAFPEPDYTFKHALTQEVAYNSLLLERRKVLHERAAQAIEKLHRYQLEDHYSDLAHHYSRSGNTWKAVEYLHLAGQQAAQRSAHAEAISHLTTALALLNTLAHTPERLQQELRLQIALGPLLRATMGYGAPEVGQVYTRARALCQQLGETSQLFPVLWGLWYFYLGRAEYQTAREVAQQCLTLAQDAQDSALLVEAYFAQGDTLLWLGELTAAHDLFEQSIALYNPQQHRFLAVQYGQDPKMTSLFGMLLTLWLLGYPDQALKRSHAALTLAHDLSHPYSLGLALVGALWVHQYRREERLVQEQAEALIRHSTEQGFPFWLAWGTILQGWALAEQGQAEKGVRQIRESLAAYQAGAQVGWPYCLALLAEAYGKAGQPEEGLTVVAEALAVIDKTGERLWEAWLYRVKGTLTLQKFQVSSSKFQVADPQPLTPDPQAEAEAEACFFKALDIARTQKARSLELRAAVSLSRLWQQQGKKEEAHQMLAEIYGWFTEGFGTKDLQEARALLEELSSES